MGCFTNAATKVGKDLTDFKDYDGRVVTDMSLHTRSTVNYENLRQRWISTIIGGKADSNDVKVQRALQSLSNNAQASIDESEFNSTQIWTDLSPIKLSVNFRKSYDRLRIIAAAYVLEQSSLHGSADVLDFLLRSCDFINKEVYNSSSEKKPGENWWNYRIGTTLPLADIGILLYDELGPERRLDYSLTIKKMVGNINEPSLLGANRAEMCRALLGAALMIDDEKELKRAREGLSDVEGHGKKSLFTYVEKGEGFYSDGSYISHHVYPYIGGYGLSHLLVTSQLSLVLQDSPYSIGDAEMEVIYQSIKATFLPVTFHGMIMGHVRGRNIARKPESDAYAGKHLLCSLLQLCETAPEPHRTAFKTLASSWTDTEPESNTELMDLVISTGLQPLTTEAITRPTPQRFDIMPMSDRVMYHQENWTAAVSMSSTRTGRYESINAENLKPFYQGDGFLQLYLTNDEQHYMNDYYPTMDPYHTPGVTAGQNTQEFAKYASTGHEDWAGGVKWNTIGSASMKHLSNDKSSAAKKSWFFFLNSIIALGTQCMGSSGTELHTTYESRNLQMPGTKLLVNGNFDPASSSSGWSRDFAMPSWAHLDNVAGYLFLDSGNITIERTERLGRWTDIDKYPDYSGFDKEVNREYLTVYRNHGVDPMNDEYAYAILPNASAATTALQAADPDFRIISNSPGVQAVSSQDSQISMATFWASGNAGKFRADTPCCAIWGYQSVEDRYYTITVADATHREDMMLIWIEEEDIGGLVHLDDGMKLVINGTIGIGIEVDSRGSRGKTYKAVFERISWRGSPG